MYSNPQTPCPSSLPAIETRCVAGWNELEVDLCSLANQINVLKICVLYVYTREAKLGKGSLLARTGGSSGDYVGSSFYNEVDDIVGFKREGRVARSDNSERLKGSQHGLYSMGP